MAHGELHRGERIGWLRAAVLGANHGLIRPQPVVGVQGTRAGVLMPRWRLVAGALSMAAASMSRSAPGDTEGRPRTNA
jgi:hypothetical protein